MTKIHYLSAEERKLIPKILDFLHVHDYETRLLGVSLFKEIFGKYYLDRTGGLLYHTVNIEEILDKIKSRNFVYVRIYFR